MWKNVTRVYYCAQALCIWSVSAFFKAPTRDMFDFMISQYRESESNAVLSNCSRGTVMSNADRSAQARMKPRPRVIKECGRSCCWFTCEEVFTSSPQLATNRRIYSEFSSPRGYFIPRKHLECRRYSLEWMLLGVAKRTKTKRSGVRLFSCKIHLQLFGS